MLWHPKTQQNLAMYNVFFIFGRFSIAGKLPKWPKIPFQYPLALRHPKILEKCRKHHRILVSVRNRFWPPPAKADIATAILTNVIENLVLLFPPISTPSPPKRCGRISSSRTGSHTLWASEGVSVEHMQFLVFSLLSSGKEGAVWNPFFIGYNG